VVISSSNGNSFSNFAKPAPAGKNLGKPRLSRCGFEKGEARSWWSYGVIWGVKWAKTAVFGESQSPQVTLKISGAQRL
jgi:hypothetical protein